MSKKLPITITAACAVLLATGLAWISSRESVSAGHRVLSATHESPPLGVNQPQSVETPVHQSATAAAASLAAPAHTNQAPDKHAPASPVAPDDPNTADVATMNTAIKAAPAAGAREANPGGSVQGNSADDSVELELPPGVQLPAALLDNGEDMTPAQQAAAQNIAENFSREIGKAVADPTPGEAHSARGPLDRAWSNATTNADEQYRALFGNDAYNRKSVESGIEAVSSK